MLLDLRSLFEGSTTTKGGGPRKGYRWTPIQDLPFQRAGTVIAHGFTDDDWLVAAIAAGMTPAEAVLLYAFAQEA